MCECTLIRNRELLSSLFGGCMAPLHCTFLFVSVCVSERRKRERERERERDPL